VLGEHRFPHSGSSSCIARALLAGGTAGLPRGLGLSRFVQTYGVDAYSLAVPVFVWVRHRSAP